MRLYQLLVLLVTAALLISIAGCVASGAENGTDGMHVGDQNSTPATQTAGSTTVPTDPADTFDYAKYATTKEEVETQIAKYGKKSTQLEISDFRYGVVSIWVYPFAIDYSYSASDFAEVGCTNVEVLGTYPNDKDMPTKILILEISDQTKQGVKDAIEILIQRPDVHGVAPDYVMKLYPDVTTVWELTEEAKQAVSAAWLAANKETLDWDAKNNLGESSVLYIGSYNGKYAIATIGDCPDVAVDHTYKIGPYTLIHNCPFDIIVCLDGELVTLSAAYEQELLTADETMAIVMYVSNFFDFDK